MALHEESSSSSEVNEKPKVTIPQFIKRSNMNMKLKIAHAIAIFVTVTYFIGFLIYPWFSMREKWKVKSKYFISQNIRQKSLEIKSITESYFQKLVKVSHLASRLVVNTNFGQSEPERMTTFIKIFSHFHYNINPFPVSATIQVNNDTYYKSSWNEKEKDFKFYTLKEENATHSKLMRYESYTFGKVINLDLGESEGVFPKSQFFESCKSLLEWTYADEGDYRSMGMTLCSQNNPNDSLIITKIEINLTNFLEYVSSFSLMDHSYFVFLDQNRQAIFESTNGLTIPYKLDSNVAHPSVEELTDTIWGPLASELNVTQNDYSLRSFVVDSHSYYTILIPIKTLGQDYHYIALLSDFTEMISGSLWDTTKIFMIYLFFGFLFNDLTLLLGCASKSKRNKKLAAIYNSIESYTVNDTGTLFKVIQQIRTIELNHPDEQILNKLLDGVVTKIAQHNVHPYTCKNNCPFCRSLVELQISDSLEDPEACYTMWKKLIAPRIATYKLPGDLKFRWKVHQSHPVKYLVQLFATIMVNEDLLFPEIDPNNLLEMVCYYAENYCQDPSLAALQLNAFHNLMHTQLKYWISKKLDRLICYICAIFFMTDNPTLAEHIISKQLNAKINEHKLPFNQSKDVLGSEIFIQWAFSSEIYEFISTYIPSLYNTRSEFTKHFQYLFMQLIQTQFVSNNLTYFGAMRILVESPNFSPMENYVDRIVLMQFVLSYASLAPFYSSSKIADEVSMKFLEYKGINTADQILCTKFCIEVVKMVVIPMTNNLTKFFQLDTQEKNLKNVIDHWTSKLKFISACADDSDED